MLQYTETYKTNNGFTTNKFILTSKKDLDEQVFKDTVKKFREGKVKIYMNGYSGEFWCFDNKVYEDKRFWYENMKFKITWGDLNGEETPIETTVTGELLEDEIC